MPTPQGQSEHPTSLIIGCGFLGKRLAHRLVNQRIKVFGTTRDERHAPALRQIGVRPLLLSVTDDASLAALEPALDCETLDVYYLVPPGRRNADRDAEHVVRRGIANTARALGHANVRSAVLASSTAVYGNTEAKPVDADTRPDPRSARARLLIDGERLWSNGVENAKIVRLAGLYGPGRLVGERNLCSRSEITGDPQAILNLIHVDDAASLLAAVAATDASAAVELGCDDHPATRYAYYHWLAARLGVPPPRFGLLSDQRRRDSKRCSNLPTRARTGWRPAYPSFRQGIEHALADRD